MDCLFLQAEDGIRDFCLSRGLGDVYKRQLMGAAGAGSVAQVINSALANQPRMLAMEEFFEGVGNGPTSGVWTPEIIARTGVGGAC